MSSGYIQWSRALLSFRAQFGSYEEEIKGLARVVQEEASLASKQAQREEIELQTQERAEQSQSRHAIIKLSDLFQRHRDSSRRVEKEGRTRHLQIDQRKLEKEKIEALDSLSSYDYHSAFRRLRRECVSGTLQWICEHPKFHEWISGSVQELLLIGKCK